MPSAKVLEQKKGVVAELVEMLKKASSGVLVDYKGINVADDTKLRAEMRKAGVEYHVIKNTLLALAARETGYEDIEPVLHGTTALAISFDDPVAPAKIINDYVTKSKSKTFKVKAGFVEGKVISDTDVAALADLPPREVLIAQILGGINSPITGLASVVNAPMRALAVAIQAVADQKAG